MYSFKDSSRNRKSAGVRAAIEPLEARAYFSTVPATVTLTVPGPIPSSAIAGVVVNDRIGVNVANDDVIRAHGRASIALFVSTDSTLSSDDAEIQAPTPVALNVFTGKNHTFPIRVKSFPQNLDGTYFIIAQITGRAVNSTVASSTATIAVQQAQIDLADIVTRTPLNARAGRRLPVSIQVTNNGNVLAKGALATSFGISLTPDGASPIELGSLTRHIHLIPGHSTILHFLVPLPLGIPTGNQYVLADVDPFNAFLEANLANNTNVGQQPVTIT